VFGPLAWKRMSSVLVAALVADPVQEPLTEATLDRAAQALRGVERRRWLDERAWRPIFSSPESWTRNASRSKRRWRTSQPTSSASRPRAVSSTSLSRTRILGQEGVDELAAAAGVGGRVAVMTDRAMRDEIAFAPALRERVALLAGPPETVFDKVLKDRITLNPGARTLAQTMRTNGALVAIVSDGFRQLTRAIRERIGRRGPRQYAND
jgi:phosphoserine phosphatase